MENRINKVMVLSNGKKNIILNQAIYHGKNYYLAAGVTEDEKDVTGEFYVLEETVENGRTFIEVVTDKELLSLLMKYLQPKEM